MKSLNKEGHAVMDMLLEMMCGSQHLTIDNTEETFMPVVVELIGLCKLGELISVAHYGESNGDAMRDPDMVFLHATKTDAKYYPTSYRNDWIGRDEESVIFDDKGEWTGYRKRMQKDHAVFAGKWMLNIKRQQKITAANTAKCVKQIAEQDKEEDENR